MSEPIRTPEENPSRVETILSDAIGLPGYAIETPPRSRVEALLIDLKDLIEGSGGSDSYATSISVVIDPQTYVMITTLQNRNGDTLGTPQTVDLPLESVVVGGSYDNANRQVVLSLQNGNVIRFSVADLVSGLQNEITTNNKLSAELVEETITRKFVSDTEKAAWNNKSDFSGSYNDLSDKPTIPDELSDLVDDSAHRTVSDTEKTTWNTKQNALTVTQLTAVNSGIDSTKVAQIATNENNISSIQEEQTVQNREIAILREITNCKLYGFKIDKQDVNPDTRVTYLYDAIGMTPAYMDFANDTFNYGSWADIWFVKNNRPVALKFDGTVDYELSHTDFTKKIDGGTASDVEDVNYAGNFMSEMPLVYVKRWEDERYNYMVFSETKPNDNYLAQAHTNANGIINPYIYLPMFKGYKDGNGKLRSLMGTIPWNTTGRASDEVAAASACGDGWQLWDKAKIDLVMDLIILITKSTSCRAKIGNGVCNTGSSASALMKSGYETDGVTRSANFQFFGTEGTGSSGYGRHHMSAFYIEDLWGNRWDRCLGFNLVNDVYKVKMVAPYVLEPDSTYQTLTITPPSTVEGWLKNISSGIWGDVPTEVGASDASGFANYFYKNASSLRLSLFGGAASNGLGVGRCWCLNSAPSNSSWYFGGSPCFNAPS